MPYAQASIDAWRAKGVVVDCGLPAFSAPIYDYITSFPNSVLDLQNGDKASTAFYTPSEVPASSYRMGTPADLTLCDDVYIMPHADPQDWDIATQTTFENFILNGGSLFAACHSVSAIEAPEPTYLGSYYLSTNGLIDWGSHDDASGTDYYPADPNRFYPYDPNSADDPIMQFIGTIEQALVDGSEQIYLPRLGSAWRDTTTVAVWDPNQADVLDGTSPGKAALVAYGRAYGMDTSGMILYVASHTFQTGTEAQNTAAGRTIGNLLLLTGIERRPDIYTSIPDRIEAGQSVSVTANVSQGTPPYTYAWSSTCGGTFANATISSTTFTAPIVITDTPCIVRVVVTDACNRKNFYGEVTQIYPASGLSIQKMAEPAAVQAGDLIAYTISANYTGTLPLVNATVVDTVPGNTTYVPGSASAGGTYDPATGVVSWVLGSNQPGIPGYVTGYPAASGTPKLAPTADTWIDQRNQTTVNGAAATLINTAKLAEISNSLLRFDLSSIPAGAVISSATLGMYVQADRTNNTATIYRMLTPWTEAGASWSDSDGAGTGDWLTGGVFWQCRL